MWGQRGMGITGGSVIMDYGLLFCPEATVINALIMDLCFLQIHSFSLHKTLIDGLESCGLLVGNCDVFISWTVILTAPIHCRGSTSEQVMLNFSKSALMQKKLSSTFWMAWGWADFHFCVNYSHNTTEWWDSAVFPLLKAVFTPGLIAWSKLEFGSFPCFIFGSELPCNYIIYATTMWELLAAV